MELGKKCRMRLFLHQAKNAQERRALGLSKMIVVFKSRLIIGACVAFCLLRMSINKHGIVLEKSWYEVCYKVKHAGG